MKGLGRLQHRSHFGYSVVELLIVCLVTMILAAVAAPSIHNTLRAYRLDAASSLMQARLLEAKLVAIKHNQTATLKVNSSTRFIEIWTTDANNFPIRVGGLTPIPTGVVLDPASETQVDFNSIGRNKAGADSILRFRLVGTSYCRSVTVSAAGNMTGGRSCT